MLVMEEDVGAPADRRKSLASQMEEMASDGAFLRAIEHKSPQMDVCRAILRKPTGKRTLEDIHVVGLAIALAIRGPNEEEKTKARHCSWP
jgi:hypothetical protein